MDNKARWAPTECQQWYTQSPLACTNNS